MKTLLMMFMVVLQLGCSKSGPIERRLGARVSSCIAQAPCVIRVKDVTDFQWDQMHVFEYGASRDEIQKSLGTDFPNYVEFKRRIVFLKDGKIVHREDEPIDIERPVNGQVSFGSESYTDAHWSFTQETAVFRAEKKEFDGGVYYSLTQAK